MPAAEFPSSPQENQPNFDPNYADTNLDSLISKRGSGFEAFTRAEDTSPMSQKPMLLTEENDTFEKPNQLIQICDQQPVNGIV